MSLSAWFLVSGTLRIRHGLVEEGMSLAGGRL